MTVLQPTTYRDKAIMHVELTHSPSSELIKQSWATLGATIPGHAFLNECWMAPWFDVVSLNHNPILITVKKTDSIAALAVAHIIRIKRRGVFYRNVLYFNEVPIPPNDMVIEYNGILAAKEDYQQAWATILNTLKQELSWDEIKINKIDPEQTPAILTAIKANNLLSFIEREDTSPYAVLNKNESWQETEKANLSSNRRRQVKKAKQLYEEKYGKLSLVKIIDKAHVDTFWARMEELHTAHWNEKGNSGAFANTLWTNFNRNMISNWLEAGTVQLTQYNAGDTPIGYLFNLVVEDRAYNIQCGFLYEQDNRLKPGFVCHHMCMEYCHTVGVQKYYYLAGGEDYKVSLSSEIDKLDWICIRKSNRKFLLEDLLVETVRKIKPLLRRK